MSRNVRLVVRPLNEREIPDHVEDKVLAKMYLETAYSLNTDASGFGWDQPPVLMIFRMRRQDATIGSAAVVDATPIPGFHHLVSNYMSQGGRMHHALLHVAAAWQDTVATIKRPDFLKEIAGVALIHEGWTLSSPDTDAAREEAEKVAQERKIHEHPDRVEVRLVHISGPNGLRVAVHAPRDGVPMQLMGQARPLSSPQEHGAAGDVPNALHFLLEVIMGHESGQWEAWAEQFDYNALKGLS